MKRNPTDLLLAGIAIIAFSLVLFAILTPNFVRARHRNAGSACKSNLKNLGTAMEMYSTDYEGKYPPNLNLLTPNYLKTIPQCPKTDSLGYFADFGPQAGYNSDGFEDYYFIECVGTGHADIGVSRNYPQYDGIQGLIER